MKLIYIAGKYSGNIRKNIKHAERESIKLIEQGWAVITPHKNTAHYKIDYHKIINMDLEILKRCDAIYMLKGWEESPGAKVEYSRALEWRKKIYFEGVD